MLGENFRPLAGALRRPPNSRRQIFARRKDWQRLSTPIGSARHRRLSPIRLCLTGAAPAGLRSSAPLCAAPPSQRRSQLCGAPHKAEIGAAWSKRSNEGRDYLSVKLDDPSFTQPIYANLFDAEDGADYSLIWSRSRKASAE